MLEGASRFRGPFAESSTAITTVGAWYDGG